MGLERLEKALDFQERYPTYVLETSEVLAEHIVRSRKAPPKFAITLGSSFDHLRHLVENPETVPYQDIPHFRPPTTEGHTGEAIFGSIEGVPVLFFAGRTHYYEVAGEPLNTGMLQVVLPVHAAANLRIPNYISTTCVGGLNKSYEKGDLVAVTDHINFLPNPLTGTHYPFQTIDHEATLRFLDQVNAYDPCLLTLMSALKQGVYVGTSGPTYESPAEAEAFRRLGGDMAGMSTVPEIIVARNRGMRAGAIALITNMHSLGRQEIVSHADVVVLRIDPTVQQSMDDAVTTLMRDYHRRFASAK